MESGKKIVIFSIVIGAIYYFYDAIHIENFYERFLFILIPPFVLTVGNTIWIIIDELENIDIERKMKHKWGLYSLRTTRLFEGETKLGKWAFMMQGLVLNTLLLGFTGFLAQLPIALVVGWIMDGAELLQGTAP